MKPPFLIIFFLLVNFSVRAQDGSDLRYLNPKSLTSKDVGKFAHLDFYNRSYRGLSIDTVKFKVKGNLISFVERRFDDGYNNWFSKQYLESLEQFDGLKLRIEKCQINHIGVDFIGVKNFYTFFNSKGELISEKSFSESLIFPIKNINEILISDSMK